MPSAYKTAFSFIDKFLFTMTKAEPTWSRYFARIILVYDLIYVTNLNNLEY